jgi:hypothetical protein
MSHRSALAILLALSLTSPASSQIPSLFHLQGDSAGDWFGYAVSDAGDVNGDGVPDFAIGAQQNKNFAHGTQPGYARVFSGVDGSTIHTFHGDGYTLPDEDADWSDGPDDHFGCAVGAIGDLNGDGYDDLLVGAFKDDNNLKFNSGMIRIFSGADGSILHQDDGDKKGDRMGIFVRGAGDITGDGVPDYLIGVYKDDIAFFNSGAVRVHSGADHSLLHVLGGPAKYAQLGWSGDAVGDTDGDGTCDFLSGAPTDGPNGERSGSAWLFSGADGSVLHHWDGDAAGDEFGHAVCAAGDVDADGFADVAASAIQSDFLGEETGPGYVRIFSGQTGALLHEFTGDAPRDQLGFSIAGAGDIDEDGHDDLLVGAPSGFSLGLRLTGRPGYARFYSGRDGSVLCEFSGDAPDDIFGVGVARLGDLDQDGFPEFIFGALQDEEVQTRPGYARVISGSLFLAERYCIAAPNSAGPGAPIGHLGTFSIGMNDLSLTVSGVPTHHFGLFFAGVNQIQVPFGDGYRCIGGGIVRYGLVDSGSDGAGTLALDFSDPTRPESAIVPGSRWAFQFWHRDIPAGGSGFNLSDAFVATFSP